MKENIYALSTLKGIYVYNFETNEYRSIHDYGTNQYKGSHYIDERLIHETENGLFIPICQNNELQIVEVTIDGKTNIKTTLTNPFLDGVMSESYFGFNCRFSRDGNMLLCSDLDFKGLYGENSSDQQMEV